MPTALITGASYGLGRVFARQLAARGFNTIVVARSKDQLQTLATELETQFGIQATPIALDLAESSAASNLMDRVNQLGFRVDLLLNNAGFGDYGAFAESDRQTILRMIQLNITTLVDLTYQCLPSMLARHAGTVINVGSIASFQPLPYMAVYAATKAFVLNFTEALWAENTNTGVRFVACCPGATETEFFKVAGFEDKGFAAKQPPLSSPEAVVQSALEFLDQPNQKATVIAGSPIDQVMTILPRLMPRELLVKGVAQQFQPKSNTP